MNKRYRLTQEGVDELKAELEALIGERSTIAQNIKTAREFGDLAENAEYQSARQEQEKNDARACPKSSTFCKTTSLSKRPRVTAKFSLVQG